MVIPRCFPEASSALALAKRMTELMNIILLDPASRAKSGSEAGYSRSTMTNNTMTGGHYILQRLGRSLCVFRYGGGIGMVIGSDRQEVSKAMADAEVLILMM